MEKYIKKSPIFYLIFGLLISFLLHLVIGLKTLINFPTGTTLDTTLENSIEIESFIDKDVPGNSVTNSTQPASAKPTQNGKHKNGGGNSSLPKTTNNTPLDDFVTAATSLPSEPTPSKTVKPGKQPLILVPPHPIFENNESNTNPYINSAIERSSSAAVIGPKTLNRQANRFAQETMKKGLFPRPHCKKWRRAHLLNTIDQSKALAYLESSQQQNLFLGEVDTINRAPNNYFTRATEEEKNLMIPISWSENSETKIGSLRPKTTTPCTGPRELIAEVAFNIDRRGNLLTKSAKTITISPRFDIAELLHFIYLASPLEPPDPRFLTKDETALVLWKLYIEAHCGIDEVLICDTDESF